jgi:hypothetical protein
MSKYTKEEYATAKKQSDELFKLILKKTGASYKDLIDIAKQQFIISNLDVISTAERQQFDKLVF